MVVAAERAAQVQGRVRVLGIDPRSRFTGYAVVEERSSQLRPLAIGSMALGRGGLAARLGEISRRIEELVREWSPESIAIERAFVGRNAQSALRIGEVRGALLAVAGRLGIDVVDYPPATVKVAVAGSGVAEKAAVSRGVSFLLGGAYDPGDAADAAAVAICHLRHSAYTRRIASRAGASA